MRILALAAILLLGGCAAMGSVTVKRCGPQDLDSAPACSSVERSVKVSVRSQVLGRAIDKLGD